MRHRDLHRRVRALLATIVGGALVVACVSQVGPTPTASPTGTATPTPSSTPASTPLVPTSDPKTILPVTPSPPVWISAYMRLPFEGAIATSVLPYGDFGRPVAVTFVNVRPLSFDRWMPLPGPPGEVETSAS